MSAGLTFRADSAWHHSPFSQRGESQRELHEPTSRRWSLQQALSELGDTDGIMSPRGSQGARSHAGVVLSRALGICRGPLHARRQLFE